MRNITGTPAPQSHASYLALGMPREDVKDGLLCYFRQGDIFTCITTA